MKERILITGAKHGFIGQNLYYKLIKNPKYEVHCSWRDLTDSNEVQTMFELMKFDKIVHLSAISSSRYTSSSNIIDVNIKATHNLLEYSPKPIDFIFSSTVLVYGSSSNFFYETDPCKPNSVYAASKLACENLIDVYYRKGQVRPRILRFGCVVGKNMKHGRMHEVLLGKTDFKLWGKPPGGFLPYITLDNAVIALEKAIESQRPNVLCNITPNDSVSLEEAIKTVNPNALVQFSGTGESPEDIYCHTEKAEYQLGWNSMLTSKEALESISLHNSITRKDLELCLTQ